jgi:hypothetical protein
MGTNQPRPASRPWPTITLEALASAAAVYGGVGLAWRNVLGMPDSWLQHSPFSSWLVPGLLLLLVVALPMGLAAALELRRSPWAPAASIVAGAAQIGWIAAQLLVLQKYDSLQPVMLGIGLLVLLLGVWSQRARPLLPGGMGTDGREVRRDDLAPSH